jgi:uncharacterized protein YjiS (DUF1127 family)
MNVRIAKEELELLLPNTMSHYFHEEHDYAVEPEVKRPGLFARLGAALRWLAEMPKRCAVLEELSMLSDHELADIGLSRADLGRVFDPAFAADRERLRGGTTNFGDRRVRVA